MISTKEPFIVMKEGHCIGDQCVDLLRTGGDWKHERSLSQCFTGTTISSSRHSAVGIRCSGDGCTEQTCGYAEYRSLFGLKPPETTDRGNLAKANVIVGGKNESWKQNCMRSDKRVV